MDVRNFRLPGAPRQGKRRLQKTGIMLHLKYRLGRVNEKLQERAGWVRRRFSSGAMILAYHRVVDIDRDPYSLAVSPKHFSEHLDVLRQHWRTIPLTQLMRNLREKKTGPGEVAITFDDGYIDNLLFAKPSLEKQELPATVFVASGFVNGAREYWWDELERIFLQPGSLPESLELSLDGKPHRFDLQQASAYTPEEALVDRRLKFSCDHRSSPRMRFFGQVHALIRPLPGPVLASAMDQLANWAKADRRQRPHYRPVTTDEVRTLDAGGLVRVGAHTVTHPDMSRLPYEKQLTEINRSKAQLEEILGRPVDTFAYPYGYYSKDCPKILADAGFDGACTTKPDLVWPGTNPFLIPRYTVFDWDGDEFHKKLRKWHNG